MASKKKSTDGITPEEAEFDEQACADCTDCEVCEAEAETSPSEALEAPSEATTPWAPPKTHTAQDGDTYASLAAQYTPDGWRKHTYALYLHEKNGGKTIKAGTVVNL